MPKCPLCHRSDNVVKDGTGGHYCQECSYSFRHMVMKIRSWFKI